MALTAAHTAPERSAIRRFAAPDGHMVISVVATVILAFLAGQALFGTAQMGISTDEPVHQDRMDQWFESGWYLPSWFVEDGSVRPDIDTGRVHAYGAGYSMFGHMVAVLAGAEEWGVVEDTAAAYNARGVAVALLGVATALAVGYCVLVVTGSRAIGVWAAAATFAIPLWTGYSMFAVKDVPTAAGLTLVSTGLVVALHPRTGRWRPLAVGLMCGTGMWFSFGTRPALWVLLAASAATFATLVICSPVRRRLTVNVTAAGAGLALGFTAVAAVHYRNAATPVDWLLSAVRTSGDFYWTGSTLTAGQLVPEKPPWWYLPAWAGGSVPLILGVLAAAGMVLVILAVARRPEVGTNPVRDRLGRPGAGMLLWMVQALLLPTVATVGGATMYAGLRQHLYVLPALAALAGFAAFAVVRRFPRGWSGAAATGLLALAIAVPAWEQTRLFPYNFVYKNPVAGPVDNRWEADMHWVSAREALWRVPNNQRAWCYNQPTRQLSGEVVQPTIGSCDEARQVNVFLDEQGSDVTVGESTDQVWVIARKYRGSPPARGCLEHDNVTRPLRDEHVVLAYVLTCDAAVLDR